MIGASDTHEFKMSRYAYSIYSHNFNEPLVVYMSKLFDGCNNQAELSAILASYKAFPDAEKIFTDWRTIVNFSSDFNTELYKHANSHYWSKSTTAGPESVIKESSKLQPILDKAEIRNCDINHISSIIKIVPTDKRDINWRRHNKLHNLLYKQGLIDLARYS